MELVHWHKNGDITLIPRGWADPQTKLDFEREQAELVAWAQHEHRIHAHSQALGLAEQDEPCFPDQNPPEPLGPFSHLDPELELEISNLYHAGATKAQLCRDYELTPYRLNQLLERKN